MEDEFLVNFDSSGDELLLATAAAGGGEEEEGHMMDSECTRPPCTIWGWLSFFGRRVNKIGFGTRLLPPKKPKWGHNQSAKGQI